MMRGLRHARRFASERRKEDGTSLIEMLVVTMILMLVLGITTETLMTGLKGQRTEGIRTQNMQAASVALDRISKDMRMAVAPNSSSAAIVTGSSASDITYYSDINTITGSGTATGPTRYHDYVNSSGKLIEEITPPNGGSCGAWTYPTAPKTTRVLASGLAMPQPRAVFTYFENGDTTTSSLPSGALSASSASAVTAVEIWLSVDNPSSPDVKPTVSVTRVYLPNADAQSVC